MKKYLFILVCMLGLSVVERANAQSFFVEADTVRATIVSSGIVNDTIRPVTPPVDIKWKVVGTNFPSDWLVDTVLGICDANLCRQNSANQLWNGTSGTTFDCTYPSVFNSRDFHLQLMLQNVVSGTYYLTVNLSDPATFYSKQITFVITKAAAAVNNINAGITALQVAPNPAKNIAHVAFALRSAGAVQYDVYDMAGRKVYQGAVKQMASGHQQIDITTAGFTPGMYHVVITTERGSITERLSVN